MTALTAVLAVGQGLATYAQGRQQASAYAAQANQEEQNARVAERNRGAAADSAAAEQRKLRQQYALVAGQNSAQLGAGGLESTSGLGAALGRANASAFQTDFNQINENLGWKDTDLRQQIANSEANAKNYRSASKSAKQWALINGVLATAQGLYGNSIKNASASKAGIPYTPGTNPYIQYGTKPYKSAFKTFSQVRGFNDWYGTTSSKNYGW